MRADVNGTEIAYRTAGEGQPVVLIHGAGLADFFAPLFESDLQNHAEVITYHRVGYGRSARPIGPVEIADQAEHCRSLLAQLGHRSAHVVGHSSGGLIALELARRSPQTVLSLALLEPSLPVPSSAELAARVMGPAFGAYLAGDRQLAIDTFLAGVGGPDYPSVVDRMLPAGARLQAAEDADTVFAVEAPSVGRWGFDPTTLNGLAMPVLSVLGQLSDQVSAVSREAHELILGRVAHAREYVLPRATHLLQLQNPEELAGALVRFIGDDAIPVGRDSERR